MRIPESFSPTIIVDRILDLLAETSGRRTLLLVIVPSLAAPAQNEPYRGNMGRPLFSEFSLALFRCETLSLRPQLSAMASASTKASRTESFWPKNASCKAEPGRNVQALDRLLRGMLFFVVALGCSGFLMIQAPFLSMY